MKIVDKFQSEIRIPNVCSWNPNSNFKTEVRKFELCLTSLIPQAAPWTCRLSCGFRHPWSVKIVVDLLHWPAATCVLVEWWKTDWGGLCASATTAAKLIINYCGILRHDYWLWKIKFNICTSERYQLEITAAAHFVDRSLTYGAVVDLLYPGTVVPPVGSYCGDR